MNAPETLVARLRERSKELSHESAFGGTEWTSSLLDQAADRIEKADDPGVVSVPYWLWFGFLARQAYAFLEDGCEGDAPGTGDGVDCSQTSAGITTEWCQPCVARAQLQQMAADGDENAVEVLAAIAGNADPVTEAVAP